METNDNDRQKPAVSYLNYGAKTAKRGSWEDWEFTVIGPHLIEVTNASYGYLKADHSYTVGVEVRDGVAVPAECECPADQFTENYDCKHKVALATVGGPTVLNAALDFEPPARDDPERTTTTETVADKLRADGGRFGEKCDCTADFPCWDCYRTGRRALPE